MAQFSKSALVKATAQATAAVGLAAATTFASAAPLDELFFFQVSGFAVQDSDNRFPVTNVPIFAPVNPNNVGDSVPGITTYDTIVWKGLNGAPTLNSALQVENFSSDNTPIRLQADRTPDGDGQWNEGDIWVLDTLTQFNQEISGGEFGDPLWIADTLSDLQIFSDFVGGNAIIQDADSAQAFSFFETVNSQTSCGTASPFFDGNGPLEPGAPIAPGCDDYYDASLNALGAISSGPIDGFIYEIGFTLVPGDTSIGENGLLQDVGDVLICGAGFACDPQYDPAPGQLRVYTPEYGIDAVTFGASQVSVAAFWNVRQQVPAPAPLALIGAGLLGLSLRRAAKRTA